MKDFKLHDTIFAISLSNCQLHVDEQKLFRNATRANTIIACNCTMYCVCLKLALASVIIRFAVSIQ